MLARPRLLVLACSAALAGSASAQEADSLGTDSRNPVLYVMEDDDSRVYLFGSIHVLDEASYPMPPDVEAAYEDAEAVAFELDLREQDDIEDTISRRAVYTNGRTLRDAMGDDYAKLEKAFDRAGIPVWLFDDYKPWAIRFSIPRIGDRESPYTAEDGVDLHYTLRAQADGKEILALETADQQIDALDLLPEKAQVQWLVQNLDRWYAQEALFEALVAAWHAGDEETLADMMNQMPKRTRLAILRDRNAAWVPQIEDYLAREGEDVMVVVGAGHLVGTDSVVAMLRARGHTLTRR